MKQPCILDAFSKPKPPSNKASAKAPSFDSSDSESEAKAPVSKAKPVTKRKQGDWDDSDSSDDLMSRIKAKTTAGSKVSFLVQGIWNLISALFLLLSAANRFI